MQDSTKEDVFMDNVVHFGKYFNHLGMLSLNSGKAEASSKLFQLVLKFLK